MRKQFHTKNQLNNFSKMELSNVFAGTYIGEHSGESYCSSDVSLDGSTNMEEGTGSDTLSLDLSMTSRTHDGSTLLHHNSMLSQVNPIDKLYLMQNSYFSSNEWKKKKKTILLKNGVLLFAFCLSIVYVFCLSIHSNMWKIADKIL